MSMKMKTLKLLLASLSLATVLLGANPCKATSATPNVMDDSHHLSEDEAIEISRVFQAIRDETGIWPAVAVIDSLNGDSIESLAVKLFNTWKLGDSKANNGLLLVLAIKEHKSRFEVGYGLEGTITDLISKVALDEYVRPNMRKGETKRAITESFRFLSDVQKKDPEAIKVIQEQTQKVVSDKMVGSYGLISWLIFTLMVWLTLPFAHWRSKQMAKRLEEVSTYRMNEDPYFNREATTIAVISKRLGLEEAVSTGGRPIFFGLFIRCFLTLNPGIFIWIFATKVGTIVSPIIIAIVSIFIFYFFVRFKTQRYVNSSRQNISMISDINLFKSELNQIDKMSKSELEVKYKQLKSFRSGSSSISSYSSGRDYSSSRSSGGSGGSGGSFSSSSGGGSSGGGGASSDW